MTDPNNQASLESSYPLHWPTGWPRYKTFRGHSRFGPRGHGTSMTAALDGIEGELIRLGAKMPVISTNVQTRLDGRPYANQARSGDPGVAVYFTLKEKRVVLACDKWNTTPDNLWAIAKHIEALRGQDRWGVGSVEQAFAGYTALNHRTAPSCWEVLKLDPGASEAAIMDQFRYLAKKTHPDVSGGSHEAFAALSNAKDIALGTAKHRREE